MTHGAYRSLLGYLGRFTLLYVLVYVAAGLLFMELQEYETVLAARGAYELYRPLDHPLVASAPLFQLVRGGLLAVVLLPFTESIFEHGRGWLLLFAVLWGGTFLGSPNTTLSLGIGVATGGPGAIAFGTTEITVQMLVFAWLFWHWQRRHRSQQRPEGA